MSMRLTCVALVDLPMSRVKFNVNSEYAYLENFKILSSTSLNLCSLSEHESLTISPI